MANQGFVQNLNLSEVENGAQVLQNLAGGTIDADLRLFAGLSSERSTLFWDRFKNTVTVEESVSTIENGSKFKWLTNYTYTDDDYVFVKPINLITDFTFEYVGFAADGTLTNPQAGIDIIFDPGENYTPGTYTNVLLEGGSGSGARGTIVVDTEGRVSSVQITNIGTDYQQRDSLEYTGIGSGVGFAITIVGTPYRCVVVGNFAWKPADLDTSNLSIEIDNTTPNLDGIYTIKKLASGKNGWLQPNNSTVTAYAVNASIYANNLISTNINLFDIDGDGVFTDDDVDLIEEYVIYQGDATSLGALVTAANNNGSRNTGSKVYTYLTGLDETLFDVDGNGTINSTDINLLRQYVINGATYVRRPAATLIQQTETDASNVGNHVISVTFYIGKNPGYAVPSDIDALYEKPYFVLYNGLSNYFDNFSTYGTKQTVTVAEEEYIARSIGESFTTGSINYILSAKRIDGSLYYFDIVVDGVGFTPQNLPEQFLSILSSKPVFSTSTEYGVFDSNGANAFFIRTNPRSTNESIKELVLFASKFTTGDPTYSTLPTKSIIPDLIFLRDDSLTTQNIQNLEEPNVTDDGIGSNASGFSYNVDNFNDTINTVTDNVDESIYLRSSRYATNRNNFFDKDISVDGIITAYDPDQLNNFQTDLLKENSPGIYIASSTSQITNTLANDYALKTRSFSSDYNPWVSDTANSQLKTESLNVTVADLVFTTEFKFDLGSNSRYANTGLIETLDTNFNSTLRAQGKCFKLKAEINGEEFYIMMRKP